MLSTNPEFKGEKVLIDKLMKRENVEIIYNADTKEILGKDFVSSLKYKNTNENGEELKELQVDGIFVHIGMIPNSNIVPPDVALDPLKQIIVNQACETNIPGLYAAGDVTSIPFNQIVIAAGMGCTALLSAVSYLNKL